jgi:abortive infection bacteriophage resistance protein
MGKYGGLFYFLLMVKVEYKTPSLSILAKTISLPSRAKHKFLEEVNEIDMSSLYATLCCIQNLIGKIQPESRFKMNLINLIDNNSDINYQYMGFTGNWRKEKIWQQ